MRKFLAGALTLSLLASCGGGGGGSAPPPTGSDPTPTPSPSSSPTPTPTVAQDPGGAKLGGLVIPGFMSLVSVCSTEDVSQSDGRVIDVGNGPLVFGVPNLMVSADYTYDLEPAGFGGPRFTLGDRRGGQAFEVFVSTLDGLSSELQIAKQATSFGTHGLFYYSELCFYAATPSFQPSGPPNLQNAYGGYVDGLLQANGDDDRLAGLRATLVRQSGSSRYELSINLVTVEDAFAEPATQTQEFFGEATAVIDLTGRRIESVPLAAPGGFAGSVSGVIGGENDQAVLLTFSLTNAAGDRIWGVVSTDSITFPN